MYKTETQHSWSPFLKLFSQQNQNRPTRIGIFEGAPGEMTDYWVEDGLPLTGIDVDAHGDGEPTIEIMLGSVEKPDTRHFTHAVAKVRFIKIVLSASGESNGLDIEDAEGRTNILRFEN